MAGLADGGCRGPARRLQLDGLQALKKIKQSHPHTKVIMVTAVETQDKIEEAMRYGADNYITKPLSLEYLEKDVQDKLDNLAKR